MPERPVVMGILNVTPDSFSDGGQFDGAGAGGRSRCRARPSRARSSWMSAASRPGPGAERIPVPEELERVMPVIEGLVARGVR